MRLEATADNVSIVLLGAFNPKIFHPAWLAMHGLISPEQADDADVVIVHSDITQFTAAYNDIRHQFRSVCDKMRYDPQGRNQRSCSGGLWGAFASYACMAIRHQSIDLFLVRLGRHSQQIWYPASPKDSLGTVGLGIRAVDERGRSSRRNDPLNHASTTSSRWPKWSYPSGHSTGARRTIQCNCRHK